VHDEISIDGARGRDPSSDVEVKADRSEPIIALTIAWPMEHRTRPTKSRKS